MARVLGLVRLSRDTEESTSPKRQRDAVEAWAKRNGHQVVGWAEDLDVSGAVEPWRRPSLGGWLPSDLATTDTQEAYNNSRAAEWDILCAWKLDRISRKVMHIWQLHEWCKKHAKQLASAEDNFDLTTPIGEVIFSVLASFAQMELETIRARQKSSFKELTKQGRFRGGMVPYGYRPEPSPDGKGVYLVIDDDAAKVVREAAQQVIDGATVNAVCRALNERHVLTPADTNRARAGKRPEGSIWRTHALKRLLQSPTLLGFSAVTKDGKKNDTPHIVRGEDGLPLRRAEPILDEETFGKVQAAIAGRGRPEIASLSGTRSNGSLLLRVGFCACGAPLYRHNKGKYVNYRCAKASQAGVTCPANSGTIRAHKIESAVVDSILATVGDLEMMEKVYQQGSSNEDEIQRVTSNLDELEDDRLSGLFDSPSAKERYRAMHKALTSKLESLEALPAIKGGFALEGTGETYREAWGKLSSDQERNAALRRMGVEAVLHKEPLGPVALLEMTPGASRPWFTEHRGRVEVRIPYNVRSKATTV